MGTTTKGLIAKDDLKLYDGTNSTFTRKTSSGGTGTYDVVDWIGVDVFHQYGGATRTDAAITAAMAAVGTTTDVEFFLSPGAWTITNSISITDNIFFKIPPGVVMDGAGTLTFDNPDQIDAGPRQKIFGSSITIVFTNGGVVHPGWRGDPTSPNVNWAASTLPSSGGVVECLPIEYTHTTAIALAEGINLIGTHTPNQFNPLDVQDNQGTVFKRTADAAVITLTGTHRTTNRGGKNLISGIAFENDADVSTAAIIDAEISDNVIIEKCSFWEDDTSTTVGHMIDVEECWDWTFRDCVFKQYGNSGGTKHAVRMYNGASNYTNYIYFQNCKFYNGKGKAIVSDAGGAGSSRNSYLFLQGCKFEDSDEAALAYLSGPLSHVVVTDNLFVTGDTRHIEIDVQGDDWRLVGNEFASIGDTPTEYINIDGSQNIRIIANYFNGIGAAITRFIHLDGTGGGGELRGVTITNNNFYEGTLGTTPMVAMTGTIHASVTIKDNADYQNETVTTNAKALMTWPGYSYLDSDDNAVNSTLAAGIHTGDIKVIVMTNADNSSTVTIAALDEVAGEPVLINGTGGDGEVLTFDAIDETWIGMWTGTEWMTIRATCTFI